MNPALLDSATPTRRHFVARTSISIALAAVLSFAGIAIASSASHRAGAATPRPHAIDAFMVFSMSIPGITGNSTAGQPGDIDVSSFQWGVSRPVTSGGAAGKITYNPFSITRLMDSASPQFFKACAKGTHYHQATLYVRRAQGSTGDTMTISFTDLLVSHVSWSASSGTGASTGGGVPTETITMVPKSYAISYDLAKQKGA